MVYLNLKESSGSGFIKYGIVNVGLASFKSLMRKILTGSLRQPVSAMQLENIERENFDRSLAKHQIRQYFPHQNFALYGKSML